jgi:uncharacterized RDD family membrane protein YckC
MPNMVQATFGGTPCNYGKRAVAWIIDFLLTVVPPALASLLGFILLFSGPLSVLGIIILVLSAIYVVVFPIFNLIRQGTKGSTFGKSQQKIALVKDETGAPIGILFAILRSLIFWIFNSLTAGIFLIVDLLFPAFDKKRQRIIDKMLSTVVVDAPTGATVPPPPSAPGLGVYREGSGPLAPPTI